MRKPVALALTLIAAALALQGCAPTYPREKLAASVEQIVKKEYNLDSKAQLIGETLYLEVTLTDLLTTEQDMLAQVLKKIEGASLAITRVSLSSDAKIKFMVLVARDRSFKLNLRIIQRLDDIKAYLYQRISRSDFEDRYIMEIENGEDAPVTPDPYAERKDLDMREFVGRLIVSQINKLSLNNPFLSVLFGSSHLRFESFSGDEIIVRASSEIAKPVYPMFEGIVNKQAVKILRKFDTVQPRKMRVLGQNNQSFLITLTP